MPEAGGQRVAIPGICWDERPRDVLHCTLGPAHRGDHFHTYTRTSWPNRGPAKQG